MCFSCEKSLVTTFAQVAKYMNDLHINDWTIIDLKVTKYFPFELIGYT
jgi:hypothetical protein